ncbi:MAG: alpha/beta fold hydrolase [Dehalococcoidia bacterium]
MTLRTDVSGGFSVRVWTAGGGSPVLYLHGLEGHPGDAPFLRRLAERHQLFAPELPGYGESSGFELIDGILGMALHHRRLVQSWGVGPVDVIGHSLGGMLAAEFAAICPQLTRRLVLVDAYGLWMDDIQVLDPFVLNEAELKAKKWANPEAGLVEPSIFVADPANPGAAPLQRSKNLSVATKFMWPIPDRGLRGRLGYVEAPTLVVHGEQDGLVPVAYADEFARLIPGAKVARIAGAGHLPMVECEDAFVEAVEGFLAG